MSTTPAQLEPASCAAVVRTVPSGLFIGGHWREARREHQPAERRERATLRVEQRHVRQGPPVGVDARHLAFEFDKRARPGEGGHELGRLLRERLALPQLGSVVTNGAD